MYLILATITRNVLIILMSTKAFESCNFITGNKVLDEKEVTPSVIVASS